MNSPEGNEDAVCEVCGAKASVFMWKEGTTGLIPADLCVKHDPRNLKTNTEGAKDTAGKPRYSLLPRKGCEAVIAVREFGTAKYHGDSENWRKVPQKEWAEAVVRHAMAFLSGEVNDAESGKHHLAHAACSALLGCSMEESE